MELMFALLIAALFAAGIYLMLSRAVVRILMGVVLFGNAVNLLIFTAGRITREVPPLIAPGLDQLGPDTANALPQALILTAIVISFSFFAFLMVLAFRAFQEIGEDETRALRISEPEGENLPPLFY